MANKSLLCSWCDVIARLRLCARVYHAASFACEQLIEHTTDDSVQPLHALAIELARESKQAEQLAQEAMAQLQCENTNNNMSSELQKYQAELDEVVAVSWWAHDLVNDLLSDYETEPHYLMYSLLTLTSLPWQVYPEPKVTE